MSPPPKLLSVVSPVYCEEGVIEVFARRLLDTLEQLRDDLDYEVVFVDDGSTDRTRDVLRELCSGNPRVRVVELARNFGHQLAITAGLDHARGDAVVVIDSDLQDPPEVIGDMVERWRKGFKVVYGVRTARPGEGRFKLATARGFYRLVDRLSDVSLPHDAGDFRLLDRAVVDVLRHMREENRYLRGMVSWTGFPQCAVEYERDPRHAGETKYTLGKMVRLALDGITSFSEKPLRVATQLGLLITLASVALLVYIVVAHYTDPRNSIRGWPSIMVALLFLGGVQLLSIGILGEYVGRIYRETKRRPLYVVGELVNFDERPSPPR